MHWVFCTGKILHLGVSLVRSSLLMSLNTNMSGWSICEPNWTPRSLCWVCSVRYQQSDPEFPARSTSFQTTWQHFLSEENCFPVRFSPRFICCVVKFVSVSRLNCGKDKSPDTNGFVAGRCSFSLLFEIIPFESHCYLHY